MILGCPETYGDFIWFDTWHQVTIDIKAINLSHVFQRDTVSLNLILFFLCTLQIDTHIYLVQLDSPIQILLVESSIVPGLVHSHLKLPAVLIQSPPTQGEVSHSFISATSSIESNIKEFYTVASRYLWRSQQGTPTYKDILNTQAWKKFIWFLFSRHVSKGTNCFKVLFLHNH